MRRNAISAAAREEDSEINLTPMLDVVFIMLIFFIVTANFINCLLYTSPSPRDKRQSRMPSSA